jgi:hypothetical protein
VLHCGYTRCCRDAATLPNGNINVAMLAGICCKLCSKLRTHFTLWAYMTSRQSKSNARSECHLSTAYQLLPQLALLSDVALLPLLPRLCSSASRAIPLSRPSLSPPPLLLLSPLLLLLSVPLLPLLPLLRSSDKMAAPCARPCALPKTVVPDLLVCPSHPFWLPCGTAARRTGWVVAVICPLARAGLWGAGVIEFNAGLE